MPHRASVDGVAADIAFEWLDYGPLTGRSLYQVRVASLLYPTPDEAGLGGREKRYAFKPVSGGID